MDNFDIVIPGDELSAPCLDFGSCYFADSLSPKSACLTLINDSNHAEITIIDISLQYSTSCPSFPATVVFNRESCTSADHPIEQLFPITLLPLESVKIIVSLNAVVPPRDLSSYPKTSYFNIFSPATLNYTLGGASRQGPDPTQIIAKKMTLIATMCMSLLYVDNNEFDFGICCLGESVSRTLQVWNRSECPLEYRVISDAIPHSHPAANTVLVKSADSGREIYPSTLQQTLPTFAAQRLELSFVPKVAGMGTIRLKVENMNNHQNFEIVKAKYNVIDRSELIVDSVRIRSDSMSDYDNHNIDIGDCYYGKFKVKKLILHNSSNREALVKLSSNSTEEIYFCSVSEHIDLSVFNDRISDDFTSNAYKNLSKSTQQPLGPFSFRISKLKENKQPDSARNKVPSLSSSLGSSIEKLKMKKEGFVHSPDIALSIVSSPSNNQWINSPYDKTKMKITSGKVDPIIYTVSESKLIGNSAICSTLFGLSQSLNGPRVQLGFDHRHSSSGLYLEYWCERQKNRSRRRFVGSSKLASRHNSKDPSFGVLSSPTSTSTIHHQLLSNFLHFNQSSEFPLESCFDTVISPHTDAVVLLLYRPLDTSLLGSKNIPESTSLSPRSSTLLLSWHHPFFDFSIRTLSFDSRSWQSRSYILKSQCCLSYITILPTLQDLKECSVGEFYSTTFSITNHSDLPTSIVPYVESDTLSIGSNQTKDIPGQSTIQLRLDYVAQLENTNYYRRIVVFNEFNPDNHQIVEVRARNIDTQHVLQHSLLYKIFTENSKRQLQLYFDIAMMNASNMRTFKIRNISTDTIQMQLLPFDEKTNGELIILMTSQSWDDNSRVVRKLFDGTNDLEISTSNSDLEDLKWGRVITQQSQSLSSHHRNSILNRSFEKPDEYPNIGKKLTRSTSNGEYLDQGDSREVIRRGSFDTEGIPNRSNSIGEILSRTYSNIRFHSDLGAPICGSLSSSKLPHVFSDDTFQTPAKRGPRDFATLDVESVKKTTKLDLDLLKSDGFPFSFIDKHVKVTSSGQPDGDVLSQLDSSIRVVQKSLQELESLRKNSEQISDNNIITLTSSSIISIAPNEIYSFMVIFNPKSTNEESELNVTSFQRSIQIKLLPRPDEEFLKSIDDLDPNDLLEAPNKSLTLKPRFLAIRGKVCRSEMTLQQKNINFGRILIGESSAKSVTITNRSAVPLLYGITKSGSISSGFLKIPSGRRGRVAPKSSVNIDFVLKPTLHGNFEEIIQIYNVLDPNNSKSLVVKAKVVKPEVFIVTLHQSSSLDKISFSPVVRTESFFTEAISLTNPIENSSQNVSSKSEDILKPTAIVPVDMGIGAVSQQNEVQVSFTIRNVSQRRRQIIIDANHLNAVVLDLSSILEEEHGFENDKSTLESVVNVRCNFEVSENLQSTQIKLTDDERQSMSDKLEKFSQKLKIAQRKNKQDKISKYEKKIKLINDALLGNLSIPFEDDEDEEDDKKLMSKDKQLNDGYDQGKPNGDAIAENSQSTQSLIPSKSNEANQRNSIATSVSSMQMSQRSQSMAIVANSDVALHFDLDQECEATVRVLMTFIPGSSYRKWTGDLPFKGFLRVFEAKNEDNVKVVPFAIKLYSSMKTMLSESKSLARETSYSQDVDKQSQMTADDGTGPFNSLIFASSIPFLSSISKFRASNAVMLATVSQWCSYPTKLIYPDYRTRKQSILGMSVKLVQTKDGLMQGVISIDSLLNRDVKIVAYIMDKWALPSIDEKNPCILADGRAFEVAKHGKITISFEKMPTYPVPEKLTDINTGCESFILQGGGKLDCLVQYQPDSIVYKQEKVLVGCACIQAFVKEDTASLQYIPIVCFLERNSSFKIEDKYVNMGEIFAGKSKQATATITNTSDEDFHYFTSLMYSSSAHSALMPSLGRALLKNGHTGVIPARSSKTITLQLETFSKSGRFEQDLWIMNQINRSDQKKLTLKANIVIDIRNFIRFPDLNILDSPTEKSKLDFGLIQIYKESLFEAFQRPRIKYHYSFSVENITNTSLYITATSNLKNQCFIYNDENCQQLVNMTNLLPKTITKFFVCIRPSTLKAAQSLGSNQLISSSSSSDLNLLQKISSQQTITSNGTTSNIQTTQTGRDLVGGLRLEFFLSNDQNSPSSNELQKSEPLCEITLDFRATVGRSVLVLSPPENTLIYVGRNGEIENVNSNEDSFFPIPLTKPSVLSSALFNSKEDNQFHQPKNSKKVRFGNAIQTQTHEPEKISYMPDIKLVEGSFQLDNKSATFTAEYEYLDNIVLVYINKPLNSMSKEERLESAWRTCSDLNRNSPLMEVIIFRERILETSDSSSLKLDPLEESTQHFGILYNVKKVFGWLKFNIRVWNVNTGDCLAMNLSAFIDPGYVTCDYSRQLHASKTSGDLFCDAAVLVQSSTHDNLAMSKGSTDSVFLRVNSNQIRMSSPLFSPNKEGRVQVIGATKKVIAFWTFRNTSSMPITVTPVSNLPVIASITAELASSESIESVTVQQFSSIHQTVRKENKDHRSILTLVSGHWKGGLYKCGDSVTVLGYSTANVELTAHHGDNLTESFCLENFGANFATSLLDGSYRIGKGFVGLVHSNQALHSFYQPMSVPLTTEKISKGLPKNGNNGLNQVESRPNLLSLFDRSSPSLDTSSSPLEPDAKPVPRSESFETVKKSIDHVEVISLTRVSLRFISPKIKIASSLIKLGNLSLGRHMEFICEIENVSDVEVPIAVESLPSWIRIPGDGIEREDVYNQQNRTVRQRRSGSEIGIDIQTDKIKNNDVSKNDVAVLTIDKALSSEAPGSISLVDNRHAPTHKPKETLGAQKLRLWLENKSLIHTPMDGINMKSAPINGSSSSESALIDDNSVTSTGLIEDEEDSNQSNKAEDEKSLQDPREFDYEVGDELQNLSMKVEHVASFLESPSRGRGNNFIRRTVEDLYNRKGSIEPNSRAKIRNDNFSIFLPPRAVTPIKLVAIAPRVESQTLVHTIRIRNVATSLVAGSIAETYDVKVILDVDSSKQIEVLSAAGQQLDVSGPRSTPFAIIDQPITVPGPKLSSRLALFGNVTDYQLEYPMTTVFVRNVWKTNMRIYGVFQLSQRLISLVDTVMYLPRSPQLVERSLSSFESTSTDPQEPHKSIVFDLMPGEEIEVRITFRGKYSTRVMIDKDIIPLLYDSGHRGLISGVSTDSHDFEDEDDNFCESPLSIFADEDKLSAGVFDSDSDTTGSRITYQSSRPSRHVKGGSSRAKSDTQSPYPYESSEGRSKLASAYLDISSHGNIKLDTEGPLGPILLGRLVCRSQEIKVIEDYSSIPQTNAFSDFDKVWSVGSSTDTVLVDVIGSLLAAPLVSIGNTSPTRGESLCKLNELEFILTQEGLNQKWDNGIPISRPQQATITIPLNNDSSGVLKFRVNIPQSFRFPCLRVELVDEEWQATFNNREARTYDSFKIAASPSSGTIPPKSSITLTLSLVPANSATATTIAPTLGSEINRQAIGRALIEILEESSLQSSHPAFKFYASFVADHIPIPNIASAPVSNVNRAMEHLGETTAAISEKDLNKPTSINRNSLKIVDNNNATTSLSNIIRQNLPTIRIRGTTPSLLPQFSRIHRSSLGQQTQKKQFIEWSLTIENKSSKNAVEFELSVLESPTQVSMPSGMSFLHVGQPRGYVKPSALTGVFLYFYRELLGLYSTFLLIRNITTPGDVYLVHLSMEVVPSTHHATGSAVNLLHHLPTVVNVDESPPLECELVSLSIPQEMPYSLSKSILRGNLVFELSATISPSMDDKNDIIVDVTIPIRSATHQLIVHSFCSVCSMATKQSDSEHMIDQTLNVISDVYASYDICQRVVLPVSDGAAESESWYPSSATVFTTRRQSLSIILSPSAEFLSDVSRRGDFNTVYEEVVSLYMAPNDNLHMVERVCQLRVLISFSAPVTASKPVMRALSTDYMFGAVQGLIMKTSLITCEAALKHYLSSPLKLSNLLADLCFHCTAIADSLSEALRDIARAEEAKHARMLARALSAAMELYLSSTSTVDIAGLSEPCREALVILRQRTEQMRSTSA